MVNNDGDNHYRLNCWTFNCKKISPVVGMILIPSIGALLLGYGIKDLVKFFNSGLESVMSVVIMFIFAIIFFGIMTDSGLFKPIVKRLILMTRGNVVIVCIVTKIDWYVCTIRWCRSPLSYYQFLHYCHYIKL